MDLCRTIQLEFLALLAADRAAGAESPLAAYLAQFPGHEEAVAQAWAAARPAAADSAAASAPEGHVGPFRLLRELGRGGQGAVWLAEDVRLGRRVALKLVPRAPLSAGLAPRFEREARVASRLDHPGICAVLDVGASEREAWIAMRHVEGETLAVRLAEGRAGSLGERLALLEKVARALHFAHEAGIVHRDVKPANVMVTPAGEPVILDFGVARSDDDGAPLTLTGDALGTPAYMAPEELRGGAKHTDRRSDVWSLGVTAFELLTGRRPFEAPTRDALVRTILETDAPDARALAPALSTDLAVVLATALEPDRDRRYQTALDFAEDLRRVGDDEPIRARPASAAVRLRRWAQRNRGLATSLAALFLVLAAALGVTALLLARTRDALARRDGLVRDVAQLSDQPLATALALEQTGLWPADEAIVPQLDAWLERSAELLGRRGQHERAKALLAERTDLAPDPARNAAAREWLGAQLDALLAQLEELARLREGVVLRRERASTLRARSIASQREAWERAADEVAAEPRYRGLALTPQLGLVPLGRDPRSRLQEFAHIESGSIPARDPQSGELRIDGSCSVVLVLVPGGEFDLGAWLPSEQHPSGAPNVDPHAARWDYPVVHVALDPYFIGKYELTQGQWLRHTGGNPALYQRGARLVDPLDPERHPIETIDWHSAERVLRELGLSLPTEAQWECAARAGTTSVYSTGDEFASLAGHANFADRYASEHGGADNWRYFLEIDDGSLIHAAVGRLQPNAFGLHDTIGNVTEWCLDTWEDLEAVTPRASDGFFAGSELARVQRGGSYAGHPLECRSAYRAGVPPNLSAPTWGLRAARALR